MTSIPSNISRVPNMLTAHLMLGAITRSSQELFETQVQMSSGRRINRPSDDAIGTSAVAVLDDTIERRDQRLRNMSHAESVLNTVDAALGDLNDLLIEAKGVASSQIGVGSDEQTRDNQAKVIDAILREAVLIANRKFQDIHLFAGAASATTPIVELKGGLQYLGEGDGLLTDLGLSRSLPITLSAAEAFGAVSARVEGERDLDPIMLPETRLADLNGARGQGIGLATINIDVGGTDVEVDLTNAHTIGDVVTELETAIQAVDPGAVVQIDPVGQNGIEIIPTVDVTISDPATDATAADLGISTTFLGGVGAVGGDLDPRIVPSMRLDSLAGVTFPLGTIRLENVGQTRDLDLSGAVTVEDLVNAVEGVDLGIRVEIAASGDRLNFINELSGGAMSIGEVAGGSTATELGVRSLTGSTQLAVFNDDLGVQIRSGSVDPITGLPDPARDVDFLVDLKDGVTQLSIDLAGATTVQDVLDTINAAAAGAGLVVGVDFEATLGADGNGIALVDNTGPVGSTTAVTAANGSFAAADLGILGSTTAAVLAGEDRATVTVDGVFSHLIALRDALEQNDERAITLAGGKLEADIARSTGARADVGVRARRVVDATVREEDLRLQDLSIKSDIQDLDFTEAAVRFALLQQQLQAGYSTAAQIANLSLLDFLR